MTLRFEVKADIKAVERDLRDVHPGIVKRATANALNRTAAKIRTMSTREIARAKGITPQRLVRERLRVTRATRVRLVAVVTALIAPLRAGSLGTPRQTKSGAKVKQHSFPGAFVAKMRSGHVGIFKRKGKPRLPIKEQSIPLQPEAEDIIDKNVDVIGAREFPKEMDSQLKRFLGT